MQSWLKDQANKIFNVQRAPYPKLLEDYDDYVETNKIYGIPNDKKIGRLSHRLGKSQYEKDVRLKVKRERSSSNQKKELLALTKKARQKRRMNGAGQFLLDVGTELGYRGAVAATGAAAREIGRKTVQSFWGKKKTPNNTRYIIAPMYKRPRAYKRKQRYRRSYGTKRIRTQNMVPTEIKIVDQDFGLKGSHTHASDFIYTDMKTSDFVYCINAVSRGTGDWERIGKSIWNHMLEISFEILCRWDGDISTFNERVLRYLIIHDVTVPNSVPPKDDMLGFTTPVGTKSSDYVSQIRTDAVGRFTILYENKITIRPTSRTSNDGKSAGVSNTYLLKEKIPLNGFRTIFKSTSLPPSVGDISTGGLYLVFLTNANKIGPPTDPQPSPSDGKLSVDGTVRLSFTD